MCGIIGYIGKSNSVGAILIEGLKRLEYRGYDSAGLAIVRDGALAWEKTAGKISQLEEKLRGVDISGSLGIAHTRWATHGEPNRTNAHPHFDCGGRIALIHNGIIENYSTLKKSLAAEGHRFVTETDTETLVHLVEKYYTGRDLEVAVRKALEKVEGTYGILVVSSSEPDKLVAARNGSPIVMGIGENEYIVASDVAAILKHTRQVIYLEDHEMIVATREGFTTMTVENEYVNHDVQEVDWDLDMIERGGHPHFMVKEIFEQPDTITNAMRGRLIAATGEARLGGLNMTEDELRSVKRILLIGCGTSWHAALIGEYMIEEQARIPVEVEYASEFRYRNPVIEDGTIVFAISQSGETVDTLAALREAGRRGARCLGICNVVGSTIARESHAGVYIHAGPEIGVASTKAFTSQITVLGLIALIFGRLRTIPAGEGQKIVQAIQAVPGQVASILETSDAIRGIAEQYSRHNNFLYLGRGANYPVALEGALKLKEISYVHAEGYPAAEMKHGPIALIDENMPVVFICPRDAAYQKIVGNIAEVKARKGKIIAITNEGNTEVVEMADHVIYIPRTLDFLYPILSVIPLQLLAYHIAVLRGCNVDQPRNLAKSVTVE
ncbi:MAG: glutamine--fructose-6-phosphate transaminase (isomerizing) [Candidatus Latescibacterota bacterium]|jgi:glucosamine--fructose-6-phosphate aminotransferase (isomerizing)|nr:MAG: glutamine--fructose-6-phosphate transaminase (isomerizing) [Candidatus Latescibacterota bacterium]